MQILVPTTANISRRFWLYHLIRGSFGATALAASGGCGSILYPERIGQRSGPLDWKVVALDGAGLMLFFIPGLIAFAVDFYNGTIFLPAGHYSEYSAEEPAELVAVEVPPKALDQTGIERVASEHLGQPVALATGGYHTHPLVNLEEFWPQTWRLRKNVRA